MNKGMWATINMLTPDLSNWDCEFPQSKRWRMNKKRGTVAFILAVDRINNVAIIILAEKHNVSCSLHAVIYSPTHLRLG